MAEVERIIFADEETRNRIREEQLKIVANLKADPYGELQFIQQQVDLPQGYQGQEGYIVPVLPDQLDLQGERGEDVLKLLLVRIFRRTTRGATKSSSSSKVCTRTSATSSSTATSSPSRKRCSCSKA